MVNTMLMLLRSVVLSLLVLVHSTGSIITTSNTDESERILSQSQIRIENNNVDEKYHPNFVEFYSDSTDTDTDTITDNTIDEHSLEEIQEEEEIQNLKKNNIHSNDNLLLSHNSKKQYYEFHKIASTNHHNQQIQSIRKQQEDDTEIPAKSPVVETDLKIPSIDITTTSLSSQEPTISLMPTFTNRCYVCSIAQTIEEEEQYDSNIQLYNRTVLYPNNEFSFFDETLKCSATEIAGFLGYVPPRICPILRLAVTAYCTCINGTSSAIANSKVTGNSISNKPGSILFDPNNTIADVPTISPASTIEPTPSSSSPISIEPCYICGNENRYVANQKAKLVIFDKETNCLQLDEFSRTVGLDSTSCAIVAQQAYTTCRCSDTAAPTPLVTLPPSISNVPTITNGPSYTAVCELCSTTYTDPNYIFPHSSITNDPILLSQTIVVRGVLYTCEQIQQTAFNGFISPDACLEIMYHNTKVLKKKEDNADNDNDNNNNKEVDQKDSTGPLFIETGCTCIAPQTTSNSNIYQNNVPTNFIVIVSLLYVLLFN